MLRWILLLLLIPLPAHAMGSDVSVEIIAWNDDGSAALIRTESSHEGDRMLSFGVISAHDATPDELLSATMHDGPGKDIEQVTDAECMKSMRALEASVAANHFRGVAVRPARCRSGHRNPLSITTTAPTIWIALPQGREGTVLEQSALEVLKLEDPHYQTVAFDDDCTKPDSAGWAVDVAARTTKLLLVVRTSRCGSPTKMSITGYVPSPTGYVAL